MVAEPRNKTSDGTPSIDRRSFGIVQLRSSAIAGSTQCGGRGESGNTEQVGSDGEMTYGSESKN